MPVNAYEIRDSSESSNSTNQRRKPGWICFALILGILVVIIVAVAVTVFIIIRKNNSTTTTIAPELDISKTPVQETSMMNVISSTQELLATTEKSINLCRRQYLWFTNSSRSRSRIRMKSAYLDDDKRIDIIISDNQVDGLRILFNEIGGTKVFEHQIIVVNPFSIVPFALLDVNNDGKLDIIAIDNYREKMTIHLYKRNRSFNAYMSYPVNRTTLDMTVIDVNNDGYSDAIVLFDSNPRIGICFNNGNGTLADNWIFYHVDCQLNRIESVDLNGDHHLDIIGVCMITNKIVVLLNTGNGQFIDGDPITFQSTVRDIAIVDLNNDAKLDLVIADSSTNQIMIFQNEGNSTFIKHAIYETSSLPYSVAVDDVNSDGRLDIVVGTYDTPNINIFFDTNNGIFGTRAEYSTGSRLMSILVVDIDNNKHRDIFVAHTHPLGIFYTYC